MSPEVFDATVDWLEAIFPTDERLDLTFHGGEPLLAGHAWYVRNLPILRQRFGKRLKLSIQSNLWLLDDAMCDLFKEYGVSIGTSLDGPAHVNDQQRGAGYFARTMAGIETARRNGLDVGVICTFTRLSEPHHQQVLDFFIAEHLNFSVHAAVATLGGNGSDGLAMSPQAHADLFLRLFDAYMEDITRVQISTFDAMARGISSGCGNPCTFTDCLGHYLTVGPRGGIYSCNRFAHHPKWQLGTVSDMPDLETLSHTPVWERLHAREATVHEDCGDCPHFDYCRGGCAYNAITGGVDRRDPHCTAYKQLFDTISDRALEEVFSEENLDAVINDGPRMGAEHTSPLMRKGKLLQIMRDGPHPKEVARQAREVVAAVALAVSETPEEALHKLDRAGVITRPELALQSLTSLRRRLDTQSQQGLVNAYLHVTYACNLTCAHCYAHAGPGQSSSMPVDDVARLVREAAETGFRKVVITGGEPLMHPQRDALLDVLSALREAIKPWRTETVLRTNLAYPLTPELRARLAHSVNQVVVSVDGDEAAHDARRGAGTYARTIANLRQLLAARPTAEVGITAVLTSDQMRGPEADGVRNLGQELDVRARFKTVLPLGRGADLSLTPGFYSSLDDGAEALAYGARPTATCGLGMNLYIAPDGGCHPCYALMDHNLGNALEGGLTTVLGRNDAYRRMTVDSGRQCSRCALRYVCGGFCRAWRGPDDLNDVSVDCRALHKRARSLLLEALGTLDVCVERWLAAGLPLPNAQPGVKRDRVNCQFQKQD